MLDLLSIVSFSCIFTVIGVYHLLVYLGRMNDKKNLSYSLLNFSITLQLLFGRLYPIFFPKYIISHTILQTFSVTCIAVFFIYFLLTIYQLSKWCINLLKSTLFIVVLISLISVILIFFMKKSIFGKIGLFANSFYALFSLIIFGIDVIKRRLYKENNEKKIIFIGVSLLLLGFLLSGIIRGFGFPFPPYYVFTQFLIVIFVFSYALINSFNKEHKELIELTNTLEQKVMERIKQLKEVNEQKTNFFINLTHEIKSPLTLLKNYLERLSSKIYKSANEEIREILDKIMESYEKLEKDIVNFFNLEKVQQGKILYNQISTVNLKDFIEKKIELFQENAGKENIKITKILEEVYIDIDPKGLDSILNNLLENSIRYNKENGSIHVMLKKEKNKVIISIEDTGIGIDKKHIAHIFEPYYQILHEKKNIQGIGIGLSIVNEIVKQCNGEIKVESTKDKGSIFYLIFQESKKEPDIIINEEITGISRPSKMVKAELLEESYNEDLFTIFLVEDNKSTISLIQNDLLDVYNVYYAINGREALSKIKKIPKPDLIVSDVMMDEMNGYEFCKKIKENNNYRNIPFIYLTAKSTINDKLIGYLKGAVDYLVKPFNIRELYVKIEKIIEQHKGNRKKILKEIGNSEKERINKTFIKYRITEKQKEIINMVKQGRENKEIAQKLDISEGTVKNQLGKIFLKTKVKTRTELLKFFL